LSSNGQHPVAAQECAACAHQAAQWRAMIDRPWIGIKALIHLAAAGLDMQIVCRLAAACISAVAGHAVVT
jgi:hypothetical protein